MSELVDIKEQIEARRKAEAEQLGDPPPEKKKTTGGPDDPRFVMQCLNNNERGDGVLFAALHRGSFLCNKSKKEKPWMKWGGHHWQYDHLDEAVRAVEAVAMKYLSQSGLISDEIAKIKEEVETLEQKADTCSADDDKAGEKSAKAQIERKNAEIARLATKRKALDRRVDRLRTVRGAGNCLTWAHCIEEPLAIKGDEVDLKPWLLPCPNGVVNLRTGKLQPGDPEDYLVRAVSIPFPEGKDVEHYLATGEGFKGQFWEKFIREIHEDDELRIAFVHRLLGYCITGLRTEHFIACFLGEGANGKGTMFETLHDVLGEMAWSIEPELILDQKNAKSSGGPNADIMSLQGRRLVVASETEQNRRVSAAKVKRLTGGDTLTGRAPHDKYEINFKPTHKLVLYTNHPPKGLASDFAMFRRLLYIWYPLRYVDNPEQHKEKDPQNAAIYRQKDPDLPSKLKAEAPWILAWLVRGCLLWQKEGGLNPPESIRAAAEAIRRDEDHIERFIEAICERVPPNRYISFKSFYDNFRKWYEENVDDNKNSRWIPTKKGVADQLRRKGYQLPPAKETSGQVLVYGLDIPGVLV
ncbi:phage/plasmid primase, P4 family [Desulfuromonas sp. KJ2020]|uniref:DNA primase family protein n=1 Tax=Desulfuromonas sp. KJ2020 TaxID=2919173 RepID=UPI0020A6E458|nr:phage/plasmid primase, P4 family [Desulfuromonas sp. KJ2020]MCP3177278.1 phage/plasmid primase, P4 family [Desulfuromonas sp. KJ2020]